MSTPSALSTTPQQAIVLLEPSNRVAFDQERTELLAIALPDEIISPAEYQALCEDQERVQAFIKRAKPAFDDVCANAHRTWKSACDLRSLFFDALEGFNTRARRLIGAYTAEQDRIRRDEERRLSEEQRQQDIKRRNEEAALLKKQGQPEMAAAVKAAPVAARAVTVPSAVPEVKGLSFTEVWKWRPAAGTDPENYAALVSIIPRQYLKLDEVKLNGIAKSMKGTLRIDGIVFYSEKVPVRR